MSPIRLSAKETAQFMRKFRGAKMEVNVSPLIPAADRSNRSKAPSKKNNGMPLGSHHERCACGLGIMIWCGPRGLGPAEESFMVEWRERHSGQGHGSSRQPRSGRHDS
jgi:hypothetical protein